MPKEIILDIETKNTFFDVGSRDPAKLDISFIGIFDYENGGYRGFWEEDLKELWPILESAERIIGFNLKYFDYPVMARYYGCSFDKFPTLDLLEEIERIIGFRIKLDDLAQATLGIGKTGSGLDAVKFWADKELEKLKEYCLQDVRVTKDLYEYARDKSEVFFHDKWSGEKRRIPIVLPKIPQKLASNLRLF
jgi:DEAD/DEAH box helicase domain-containing protein